MREHHIIGPPGTGKTRTVAKQAGRAVERYGPAGVAVLSLTRAAAREAAGRLAEVEHVGTLHSMCFRGLGGPKLVSKADIDNWNRENPSLRIDASAATAAGEEDVADDRREGSDLYAEVDLLRSRCVPEELWPERPRRFGSRWRAFKAEAERLDFTDLIEHGLRDLPLAPGSPGALFADEVQDFSALELRLVRRWGSSADNFVLVGDPLQSIYEWRGADAEVFARPAETRRVLSQSYRVPAAIHKAARRIVRGLPGSDDEYQPRLGEDGAVAQGEVKRTGWRFQHPESWIPHLIEEMREGRSVMVLVSCTYMLAPVIAALRESGIPYQNPYSPRRWNPLTPESGVSTVDRLRALLRPHVYGAGGGHWTAGEVRAWIEMLRAEYLARGTKTQLLELGDETPVAEVERRLYLAITDLDLFDALWSGNLAELRGRMTAKFQRAADYPLRCLARRGHEVLLEELDMHPRERPWVTIGTCHSVKGGQADTVLVFPDLSRQGWEQSRKPGWSGADAIRRLFYVAFTRARERLLLGDASGSMAVRW